MPLVQERYLDLPIGGLDDMSVWANWVWQRVARWFNTGPPPVVPPSNADAPLDDSNDHEGAWMQRFVSELQSENGVTLSPQAARKLMVSVTSWQQLFEVAENNSPEDDLMRNRKLWYIGPKHMHRECTALLTAFQKALSPLWHTPQSITSNATNANVEVNVTQALSFVVAEVTPSRRVTSQPSEQTEDAPAVPPEGCTHTTNVL